MCPGRHATRSSRMFLLSNRQSKEQKDMALLATDGNGEHSRWSGSENVCIWAELRETERRI